MDFDLVIDSSAMVSIIREEISWLSVHEKLSEYGRPCIPAPTLLESLMVLTSAIGPNVKAQVDVFLASSNIQVVEVGEIEAHEAYTAFLRYGKGRHPAALNFGDCMVYALARRNYAPILCVGNDFAQTDIAIA